MENILSSFKITGVSPFDRSIIKAHTPDTEEEEFSIFKPEVLARKTGLAYVPLYSPAPIRSLPGNCKTIPHCDPSQLFYEQSHLKSESYERDYRESSVPAPTTTTLGKFLVSPLPPRKLPTKKGKSAGTVLTSLENLLHMQEKEKKKQEDILKKEERKRCREEKQKLKNELMKKKTNGNFS